MQHIHTLMTFRHSSCSDPWEKPLEILIISLQKRLGSGLFPSCVREFTPLCGIWLSLDEVALYHLTQEHAVPIWCVCSTHLVSVWHSLGLKCAPKAMWLLLFKACPIFDINFQDRPLLSAHLTCSRGTAEAKFTGHGQPVPPEDSFAA